MRGVFWNACGHSTTCEYDTANMLTLVFEGGARAYHPCGHMLADDNFGRRHASILAVIHNFRDDDIAYAYVTMRLMFARWSLCWLGSKYSSESFAMLCPV